MRRREAAEEFGFTYQLMTAENFMTVGNATASIFTPKTYSLDLGEGVPVIYFSDKSLQELDIENAINILN